MGQYRNTQHHCDHSPNAATATATSHVHRHHHHYRISVVFLILELCAVIVRAGGVQPLPPNTGMMLVAEVAGTTSANDAFWSDKCRVIPADTLYIVVQMGTVTDFFRPIDNETSYCTMLQSNTKHQWSKDGVKWTTLAFWSDRGANGGSTHNWPRGEEGLGGGDKRKWLSVWGHEGLTGGCCSSSTAEYETHPSLPGNGGNTNWGQACTYTRPCAPHQATAYLPPVLEDNDDVLPTYALGSTLLTSVHQPFNFHR